MTKPGVLTLTNCDNKYCTPQCLCLSQMCVYIVKVVVVGGKGIMIIFLHYESDKDLLF